MNERRTEGGERWKESVVTNAIFGEGQRSRYTFLRNEPNFPGEENRC